MPALNIRLTEAELTQLRERARIRGVSMATFVHDAIINYGVESDRNARWAAATDHVASISQPLLAMLADQ